MRTGADLVARPRLSRACEGSLTWKISSLLPLTPCNQVRRLFHLLALRIDAALSMRSHARGLTFTVRASICSHRLLIASLPHAANPIQARGSSAVYVRTNVPVVKFLSFRTNTGTYTLVDEIFQAFQEYQ